MGDFVVHRYHQIDLEILWNTASLNIPALLETLTKQPGLPRAGTQDPPHEGGA